MPPDGPPPVLEPDYGTVTVSVDPNTALSDNLLMGIHNRRWLQLSNSGRKSSIRFRNSFRHHYRLDE
jgi:hypothetical protein